MQVAQSVQEAERQLSAPDTDALVKSIGIPPRPATLAALQREVAHRDPNLARIGSLVANDVAITAALLRIINSPAYGLARRCETVGSAIAMLGLKQVTTVVTGLILRKSIPTEGPLLTRFWDVSAKRAFAMTMLAKRLGGVDADIAQSFGLFCDVGIPLLMQRFPDYGLTLKACNDEPERSFTEVEQSRHNTDHALIGALMARTWGISQTVCLAIRLHHDFSAFQDRNAPEEVMRMIAMGLLSEVAIQRFANLHSTREWDKGGEQAAGALMLNDDDVGDWLDRLMNAFAAGLD